MRIIFYVLEVDPIAWTNACTLRHTLLAIADTGAQLQKLQADSSRNVLVDLGTHIYLPGCSILDRIFWCPHTVRPVKALMHSASRTVEAHLHAAA